MEVLVIQPPSLHAVALDQAGGRASHIAPPWEPLCLLSFLRQRTRHTGRVFDARVRKDWRADLARNIATNEPAHLAVIHCGHHDGAAVREVVEALRPLQPGLALAAFGALPTSDPAGFRARHGVHFAIVGDPEPTLRHLLDNFSVAFRRQRIPALVQDGVEAAAPVWADLKSLALPDWRDVSFSYYESRAHPDGNRVDMRLSRGSGSHPMDTLVPDGGAPLRIGAMDRMAEAFQECAHLGISEVRFTDSPDVWDGDVLDDWLARLERVNNVQPWSLRLLAMPLSDSFRHRLAQQHCHRIEMLVPSCYADLAAHFRYDPPGADDLLETLHWFRQQRVDVDLVFWAGGANEPRGEARRITRFVGALRFPDFSIEARPDVAPDAPHVAAIARSAGRRVSLSPARKIRRLFSSIKNIRVTIDQEQRELIVKPRGVPQSITGVTDFHALETSEGQNSNDWKN